MKKNVLYVCGVLLIGLCFFYCSPISLDTYENFIVSALNGLFFNYLIYYVIKILYKKNKLKNLIIKTNGLFSYFPHFITFLYCTNAFFYMITLIWIKDFALAGTILPALFSIDASSRSNKIIKEIKQV